MSSRHGFHFISRRVTQASVAAVLATGLALSQENGNAPVQADNSQQQTSNAGGGWPRADDRARNSQAPVADPAPAPGYNGNAGYGPNSTRTDGYGGREPGYQQPPATGAGDPVAQQLTIRPGTFVTVRVNQTLSSDRNHAGDAFSATLVRPIVVDGVVVAQRGQMLGGRVSEAEKAGRVEGTSRLGIQLTDLTLVDGQQVPIHSQFISRNGPTSNGRDAGAIAGTTALGAAIGAAADWGRGAAIGAGAGAAAGIVGVLLTRGQPTVISSESVLTFRIEAPVTIATDRAPQAFRYVDSADYDQQADHQSSLYASQPPPPAGPPAAGPSPAYYYGPSYYPYPYAYGYPVAPYYWGPSFYVFSGPRYYYGPRYYGGYGYRGGYYRAYHR